MGCALVKGGSEVFKTMKVIGIVWRFQKLFLGAPMCAFT